MIVGPDTITARTRSTKGWIRKLAGRAGLLLVASFVPVAAAVAAPNPAELLLDLVPGLGGVESPEPQTGLGLVFFRGPGEDGLPWPLAQRRHGGGHLFAGGRAR